MPRLIRLFVGLCLVTAFAIGSTQMATRWSKRFVMPGWDMFPNDVAVDLDGNVYVAAERNQGLPSDVVVSKFRHDGVFLWSRYFDDGGAFDPRIEVTSDGKVFVSYRQELAQTYIGLIRLSTENGVPLWQRYYPGEMNADLLVRDEPGLSTQVISLFHSWQTNPKRVRAVILNENGGVTGQHVFYPPSDWTQPEPIDAVVYGNQFAYLVGQQAASIDHGPCKVVRAGLNGSILTLTNVGRAGQMAYSSVAGGRLITVGASENAVLQLNLINALTGQLLKTIGSAYANTFKVTVFDAEADDSGSLYVVGRHDVTAAVANPLCVRYSYPGLQRIWMIGPGVQEEELQFEHLSMDPFGTLFASSLGSTSGARVYGVDAPTGRVVGFAHHNDTPGFGSYFNTLAVNSRAIGGHALARAVGNDLQLFVQQVQPVGLLNLTLPNTQYTGTVNVTGTVRMHLPTGQPRTVFLQSSSGYASVPAAVSVPAGATSKTFTVNLSAPPSDRNVTLVADDGRSRRFFTFLLKKP